MQRVGDLPCLESEAVWHSDTGVDHIIKVTVHRSWSDVGGYLRVYCLTTIHSVHLSLLPSVGWEMITGHGAVAVLCGWEDDCQSGVVPAAPHRLCGISTYGLNGVRN